MQRLIIFALPFRRPSDRCHARDLENREVAQHSEIQTTTIHTEALLWLSLMKSRRSVVPVRRALPMSLIIKASLARLLPICLDTAVMAQMEHHRVARVCDFLITLRLSVRCVRPTTECHQYVRT